MDDTDRLTRQIHELQGSMLAMECFVNSLTEALSSDARVVVQAFYASESTAFRTAPRQPMQVRFFPVRLAS